MVFGSIGHHKHNILYNEFMISQGAEIVGVYVLRETGESIFQS